MTERGAELPERFRVVCLRCNRAFLARKAWVGQEVQCPHCASALRVPPLAAEGRPVRAEPPAMGLKRNFNFACPRCECLLETHTGMTGQTGRCPTCAAQFIVPPVDPRSGKVSAAELVEGEVTDPTPLHAYAASGRQAPRIVRLDSGEHVIECSRCGVQAAIDANVCAGCGVPFTIEATPTARGIESDSRAVASVVLGIVGIPLSFLLIPGLLAIVFAWLSIRRSSGAGVPRMAAAGLALGVISVGLGALLHSL